MPFYSWIRYIFIGTLLIALSVACRSASPFSAGLSTAREGGNFSGGGRGNGIPPLLQLIRNPEFLRTVAKRPVFLGVHENGRYVAMITGEPDGKALRLVVVMPGNGEPAASWRLPAGGTSEENGDLEEHLELVRSMVVRGYGIRLPARPVRLVPGEEAELDPERGWIIRIVREHGHDAAVVQDEDGHAWSVAGSFPADRDYRFELLRVPGAEGKWLLAVTDLKRHALNVFRLDLPGLASAAPDGRILDECRRRLRVSCRIAWRGREGRGLVLAVSETGRSVPAAGLWYRGSAGRFAVFSSSGRLLAAGWERGFIEQGKPVSAERKRVARYRIDVLPGPDASSAYMTADAFDSGDRLLRTMEWEWNMEKGSLRRVGGGP